MYNIIIADDHTIFREGLKKTLEDTGLIKIAGEAGDGFQLLDLIRHNKYDMIILDISMPGRDGLDTLIDIKRELPDIPVLILSMHSENHFAMRLIKSGAAGYVNKDCDPDDLLVAIKKVMNGKKYVSESLSDELLLNINNNHDKPQHESLSHREFQVLIMTAEGKSIKQIAQELCLSVKTVSTYRSRLMEKMQLKNHSEIVHYAIKHLQLNY